MPHVQPSLPRQHISLIIYTLHVYNDIRQLINLNFLYIWYIKRENVQRKGDLPHPLTIMYPNSKEMKSSPFLN